MRRRAPFIALLLALLLGGGTVSYVLVIAPDDGRDDRSRAGERSPLDPARGKVAEGPTGEAHAAAAEPAPGVGDPAASAGDAAAISAVAPEAAPPAPDPAFAIGGTVVDADGREVAGAAVELYLHRADAEAGGAFEELMRGLDALAEETPIAAGRTDLGGRFALVAGAPGEYRVRAQLAPLAAAVEGPFRLTERDPAIDLLIVLGGGLAISGFVADETGTSVAGAEVALLDQLEGKLPGQHYHAHRTVSAADGSFAFEGVEPRRYIVIAVADGYARALVPSVTPPLDGLRVEVSRGREIVVRVLGAGTAGGGSLLPDAATVAGASPVAGAEVYAVNPVGFAVATTDESGLARLAIGGRDLSLRVVADGFATARVSSVEIPEDPAAPPTEIVLDPLETFDGVVVRSDGSRAPFAELLEYGGGLLGSGLRTIRADGEGRFTAASPFVVAALNGEVSDLVESVSQTIALVPTISVTGRIVRPDGRPAVGATVRVSAERAFGNHGEPLLRFAGARTVATAGADGRFLLEGVPTWGALTLVIECDGSPDAIVSVEEDLGEITLGEEAVLEGRIVTPEGGPPPAAAIVLELPGSSPVRRDAATGALRGGVRVLVAGDGSFRIDRLTPGSEPLELHVVAPPFLEEVRRFPLVPGPNGPVEIALRAGGEARVTVKEGAGEPCAAARVELSPSGTGPTRRGRTGPDGVARFTGIAAGSYTVSALTGASGGAALLEVIAGEVAEVELTVD